jgi:hypothetical protein
MSDILTRTDGLFQIESGFYVILQSMEQPEVLNQEIAQLEAKLAAKKQELMHNSVETPEKHVFKEVVREHAFVDEAPKPTATTAAPSATRTLTTDEQNKINGLIAQAFSKGIASAVADVRKIGDPFLIDALHDQLADQYYAKLLQARQLKQ